MTSHSNVLSRSLVQDTQPEATPDPNSSLLGLLNSTSLIYMLGSSLILLALFSYLADITALQVIENLQAMFSTTFLILFLPMLAFAVLSIAKVMSKETTLNYKQYWAEVAMQLANGVSTLALTFTLLGISLGIGALSHQSLGPDNVDTVISELTSQFSMAFMTTVVGLPCSALLRSLASIALAKSLAQEQKLHH